MVNFVPFPPVSNATDDGLLAMGGDLSVDTLVSAYAQGIFPWFNNDQPILWWSPDPRLVLFPERVKVSRSLRKSIRNKRFRLSCNRQFDEVVKACSLRGAENPLVPVPDTWITKSMHEAYSTLHQQGYAHSIEVWSGARLVGGLYGVALGNVFFGESMFSRASDASKVALVGLCNWLGAKRFRVIDCQVASDHLYTLGAEDIPREDFLLMLDGLNINQPSRTFFQDFENLNLENAINKT